MLLLDDGGRSRYPPADRHSPWQAKEAGALQRRKSPPLATRDPNSPTRVVSNKKFSPGVMGRTNLRMREKAQDAKKSRHADVPVDLGVAQQVKRRLPERCATHWEGGPGGCVFAFSLTIRASSSRLVPFRDLWSPLPSPGERAPLLTHDAPRESTTTGTDTLSAFSDCFFRRNARAAKCTWMQER